LLGFFTLLRWSLGEGLADIESVLSGPMGLREAWPLPVEMSIDASLDAPMHPSMDNS